MKNKRIISVLISVLVVLLLIVKAEYASLIYRESTCGMPALVAKGSIENLYLGSSMFRQGLDIESIENHQGDSYILAYNGNQPVSELIELEYLISNNVKTYVIDDAELERVYKSYPVMWKNKDAKPSLCFIGCPHLTLNQLKNWTGRIEAGLKARERIKGLKKGRYKQSGEC